MNTQDLDEAVSLLTRWTPQRVECADEHGHPVTKFKSIPPLIGQLRAAITPGMEQGGGGASGGRPAPMALNAFDLLRKIDETSTFQYWTNGGTDRLVAISIERRIRHWAIQARRAPEPLAEATRMISGWVKEIEALFNPQKRIELTGKCPGCRASHYLVEEDGELIRKATLTATPATSGSFAECGNCGARWEGHLQMEVLATLLALADAPAQSGGAC